MFLRLRLNHLNDSQEHGVTFQMKTRITEGFWHDRLEVNTNHAIFHQWDQLEASGCIENFRIAAGDADGFREGWFFADSDAYKWLDAASRIYASHPAHSANSRLDSIMNDFIVLLERAQQPDGYLFTYNQIHFPSTRWVNLQIEHELYCHGHLIEAGVSHYEATKRTDMLDIARCAADRIVADFLGKSTGYTPGHEEIEIALLRLYQVTNHQPYLLVARQFIEQRGRNPLFALSVIRQNSNAAQRSKFVQQKKQEYLSSHPEFKPFRVPPGNAAKKPHGITLRWCASALSGKYFQQHTPVNKQIVPVGHSVRFAYLETAIARLARVNNMDREERKDYNDYTQNLSVLEQAWEHMVACRMYVTGGIGSLPAMEGFGNDYELDPEYAYSETCAALGSMFWNWEMVQLTHEAKYSDLFEWQLYNASAVGMGLDGESYLYNNPLACRGGVTRKPWYAIPCCPSNISRTWAYLDKYIYSSNGEQSLPTLLSEFQHKLWIHQYISSQLENDLGEFELHSNLPWNGKVEIKINSSAQFTLQLRMPSWSINSQVKVNGQVVKVESVSPNQKMDTASGYDPRAGYFISISHEWSSNDLIELNFDMAIMLRHAHRKVKGHKGKVAVTRGPLVYCLENIDNPKVDIFKVKVDTASLQPVFEESLLGGIVKIEGKSDTGHPLTFIPYHLWGNRGETLMTVWVNT
jgi:uncharacterized protein